MEALETAGDMLRALVDVNEYVAKFFGESFQIGIGIHYGPAVVGEIGYPGQRQFSAIGDTVNTASRVETATKEFGASVLMSDTVYEAVKDMLVPGRSFEAHLKGKMGVSRLHEFVGFAG
jgi:adenylate cyclase